MVLAINAANRDIKGRSPMPHHTPTLSKIFGPNIAHLPALGFRSERCVGFHTPPGSKSMSWQMGNFWPKKFVKGRSDQRCQCPVWYETWEYLFKKGWIFRKVPKEGGGIQKCLLQSMSCFDFSQNNCWKNIRGTLTLLFCINFMFIKPCLKFPKSATYIFLDWKSPPPPLWNFSEK